MTQLTTTYIRLPDVVTDENVQWLIRSDDSTQTVHRGTLSDLSNELESVSRFVLLAPASTMVTLAVDLPGLAGRKLSQALPYAVEESFAEDIENLHIAHGSRRQDGKIPVVGVSHKLMRRWCEQFAQLGVQPRFLLHESLSLPWQEGQWTLLLDKEKVLLRTSETEGISLPASGWHALLSLVVGKSPSEGIERVHVYDTGTESEERVDELKDIFHTSIDYEVIDEPLTVLAQGADSSPINLLQGKYGVEDALKKLWRPWRLTAILVLAILLVQGGLAGYRIMSLYAMDEQLYAEIRQVFRETIPEAKSDTDPVRRMESKLVEYRGGGNGSSFSLLLTKTAPVLAQMESARIQRLRYRQGELEIELELESLQSLDTLKSRLQKSGVTIEVRSASSSEQKVISRIAVKGAGV